MAHSTLSDSWRAWWLAARPRTLTVALAPVLVGSALAHADQSGRLQPALAAGLAALLIQIGANFSNDLFDHEKGADGPQRIGPPRAMQLGLLQANALRRGITLAFTAAAGLGLYLVWIGGWPIALVGALSIAAGLGYSGGRYAFGYHGLGDLAVFVFFGVVAVCGSYYVQALTLPLSVFALSLPVGGLATAILVVNNIRDLDSDERVGKRTLAVLLGPRAARIEYGLLMLLPFTLLPLLALGCGSGCGMGLAIVLPLLTLPWAIWLVHTVWRAADGPSLNAALVATARLEFGFCLLFSLGWLA